MTSLIITIIVAVVFVAALVVTVVRRGMQLRHLAERGVQAKGAVGKMWSHGSGTGSSTNRLRYRFTASDGREFKRSIMISPGERDTLREGAEVTVVYLPDNPRVSALLPMVEQAREALAKRKSSGR